MRNAGDLATAADLYPQFQKEAASLARSLGLPQTQAIFAATTADLEHRYFDMLGDVVDELKRNVD